MFYDKIALVVDDSPTVSSFITHILKDALARMFHKPCCWSKTTGLVDVRRPG